MDLTAGYKSTVAPDTSARSASPARTTPGPLWFPLAAIALGVGGLFILRLASPPNLLDHDQERPAAYVLDAVQNGHWICQRDWTGDISSKPPLWTWLSALVTLACGRISLFSLYLPGAVAALGTTWLVFAAGRRHFGARAAWFAVPGSLVTWATLKEIGLARTDGVFCLTVTAGALLAYRAWMTGRGWTWFWLVAALATLAKGPLGVILAAGGLLAVPWERSSGEAAPLRGSHWGGIVTYALIVGGWFLLAYRQFGDGLVAKMLDRELIGHALSDQNHTYPGMHFYQPPLYYLSQSTPWSVFGCYSFWAVWKAPAVNRAERRFERFLFCWFMTGLAVFCLSPNQRADYLWPILPAAALLTGRELEQLTSTWRPTVALGWAIIIVSAMIGGALAYHFILRPRAAAIQETVALKNLASEIERQGGAQFPLTHVDDPMTLQIWLNTLRSPVSILRAADLLRGPEPAYVAVDDLGALQAARKHLDSGLYTLLPENPKTDSPTHIVSNRPRLESSGAFAFCCGPLRLRAHQLRLLAATEDEVRFAFAGKRPDLTVVNESAQPYRASICVIDGNATIRKGRLLAPAESWNALK